jgi:regulator of protease activity HflC (stomatin/prohibitin superfamily)
MNVAIAIRGLATFAWIATVVGIVFMVQRSARGYRTRSMTLTIIGLVILAVALTSVGAGLVFVEPEMRGVVISAVTPGGLRDGVLPAGLNWIVPFFERVETYPISRQTYTMSIAPGEGQIAGDDSIAARTSDGQVVLIDASVIFAIDPEEVVNVHVLWQDRYESDLVRAVARGVIRDQASQYRIDEIISSAREEFVTGMTAALTQTMQENGLILHDFVLRNIQFSDEYAASVEQKLIAEQQAQQAAFVVEQRQQEAEQARAVARGAADAVVIAAEGQAEARLIQAEAEAMALELIAAVLAENPSLLTYEYIQRLAPGIQVMLVPNDNPFLLPLPDLSGSTGGGILEP